MNKIKIDSNRKFGLVFFIVFLIYGLWPITDVETVRFWPIIISLVFLVLGLLNSRFLTPLIKLWFIFGKLLGYVVTPFVMAVVFFLAVTPYRSFYENNGQRFTEQNI